MLFLLPLIVLSVSTIFLVCSPLSFVLPLDSLAQTPSRYQTHISVLLKPARITLGQSTISLSLSLSLFLTLFLHFNLWSFCIESKFLLLSYLFCLLKGIFAWIFTLNIYPDKCCAIISSVDIIKNGPNPASFLFFSRGKYSTNIINDKSLDGVLGTRTRGGRMVSYGCTPPITFFYPFPLLRAWESVCVLLYSKSLIR